MRRGLLLLVTFLSLIFLLLRCSWPSREELQNIADLLNSKQYSSAISKLEHLSKKYPSNARIYYYLGYAYLNNKDYNKALKNLQEALRLKQNFKWVIGDTTLANFLAGNSESTEDTFFKTAVRELRKIIDENRGKEISDEIRYHVGVLYIIKKEYKKGIDEFQNVIDEEPKGVFDAKARMKIGDIYINFLDNPAKGIEEYKKVVNDYGKSEVSAEASLKIAVYLKNRMLMYKDRYEALKKFLNNWKGIKEMEGNMKLAESQSLRDLSKAQEFQIKAEENLKKIIKEYPDTIFQKKAENELSEIKKDFHEM